MPEGQTLHGYAVTHRPRDAGRIRSSASADPAREPKASSRHPAPRCPRPFPMPTLHPSENGRFLSSCPLPVVARRLPAGAWARRSSAHELAGPSRTSAVTPSRPPPRRQASEGKRHHQTTRTRRHVPHGHAGRRREDARPRSSDELRNIMTAQDQSASCSISLVFRCAKRGSWL